MKTTKEPEIISIDVPMQVMDHDPDVVWDSGARMKDPSSICWDRWFIGYTSEAAAQAGRSLALKDSRYYAECAVSNKSLWDALDYVRSNKGKGLYLYNEAMQEVRRWTV